VAVVFVTAGLCFRVTAVPLHFYAPDVYQGSPMVVAATLAWIPKFVGFLAIVRTLTAVFSVKGGDDPLVQKAVLLSWIIAAATMIWGNFLALLQEDLKRLMAYSSIAHAGYMMVGVTAALANDPHAGGTYSGSESVFFYLVTYGLMTLGVFGGFMALKFKNRPVETVDDLSGLGWTHPWPALGLSVCLLSLAGIPPLAGFWGKFQLFSSLLVAGDRLDSSAYALLAVVGMLSAAAGAYYYLRIVVVMYFGKPKDAIELTGGWPLASAVGICVVLTVLFGINSAPLSSRAHAAAQAALAHPQPGGASVAVR
jgi:NADH-quinone oxidoreductase subunit N